MEIVEKIKWLLLSLVLALVLIYSASILKKEKSFNAYNLPLKTQNGFITLGDYKNKKLVLLYFGFLSCPDACPTTLSKMSHVFKELPKKNLDAVTLIFVDLDPARDSLQKIAEYTHYFNPLFQAVSLDEKNLDLFTKAFGIAYMKVPLKSSMGYTIDHSTDIKMISPSGELLDPFFHDDTKEMIRSRLFNLTNQF